MACIFFSFFFSCLPSLYGEELGGGERLGGFGGGEAPSAERGSTGRGTHGKEALDVEEIYDWRGATTKETAGD